MKKKFTMSEQEVHAQAERIAVEMADLLTLIETQRATWTHNRDVLKATKERLAAVDDEVTDERAELISLITLPLIHLLLLPLPLANTSAT